MSLPICSEDCTSNLPTFDFSLCSPDFKAAQISKVFFTSIGNPMINWASAAEWDSRIDNDSSSASNIRALMGIGDLPAPASTEKEGSLGRVTFGKKTFTLNFKVDETNVENHDSFRLMQCAGGNYLVWFETRDHLLFGDNSGISASIKVDQIIPESFDEYITYQLTITWKDQFMPKMIASPIVDTTGDQFNG